MRHFYLYLTLFVHSKYLTKANGRQGATQIQNKRRHPCLDPNVEWGETFHTLDHAANVIG
jgi:hypothetical protein